MKRRNAAWRRSGTRKSARQMRAREAQPRNRVRTQLRAVRLTTDAV